MKGQLRQSLHTATTAPIAGHSPPPSLGEWSLSGARVAVVGSGEVLARVLSQLHTMGAGCIALEDPYHAAADIARRHDRYDAIVIALPCLYLEELPVIATMRRLAPSARIILAAADQHVSMLAAAIRQGAWAVLTAHGIEVLAAHEPATAATPVAASHATAPPAADEQVTQPVAVDDESADEITNETNVDSDEDDDFSNGHPLLTAEELHALLHDEGEPLR